ncbi:hypothetical protein AYL99_03208 [Fonsecaea erecta]|uniref:Transcription factor domain-containing protein n=1 Tax=Fonsecaea erecta TaxID=1367422 RepID=A0A178ZX26_9EURO|nr:hypothetical protein AYL99_03208 [Fonsecaea erecta]OAP63981.1 hypothetical protein AYL99_03208 [Fonsecaea erecta]
MFQGNFSFVNVDASSLSTLPHRQRVTRHVHGYRRWKKGQDARRLLESSRFHEVFDSQSKSLTPVSSRATREERPCEPAPAPPSSRSIRNLPPLLDIVLLNSHADPSSVLPEQLAVTTNSLLDFERDCVVPAVKELELRLTAKENVPSRTPFTQTWIADSKASLYDSIANNSYLSRIAATRYMVTANPEHLDAAHKFRHKGVASIREYMTTTPRINIPRLYRALLLLLFADSWLGDRQAFYQHVTVLQDIFASHQDEVLTDPSFNIQHCISVICLEVQFAVMNFSAPSVDLRPNGWAEKQFLPLWEEVSACFLTSRPETGQNLDPYLQGDIRTLFLDAQEALDVVANIGRQAPPSPSPNSSQIPVYAVSKTMLTVGRLMNLYAHLDVDTILCHENTMAISSRVLPKLEVASAALCAIYWLREMSGIENIRMTEHIRLFTWNPSMLSKLRHILTVYEAAEMDTTGPQEDNLGRERGRLPLLLWILWTAATVEHSISTLNFSTATTSETWFTQRFSQLARNAGIESMSQCQVILDRILQVHGMRIMSPGGGWTASCFSQAGEEP